MSSLRCQKLNILHLILRATRYFRQKGASGHMKSNLPPRSYLISKLNKPRSLSLSLQHEGSSSNLPGALCWVHPSLYIFFFLGGIKMVTLTQMWSVAYWAEWGDNSPGCSTCATLFLLHKMLYSGAQNFRWIFSFGNRTKYSLQNLHRDKPVFLAVLHNSQLI